MGRSKRFKPNKSRPRTSIERILMAPVPPDSEMGIENTEQILVAPVPPNTEMIIPNPQQPEISLPEPPQNLSDDEMYMFEQPTCQKFDSIVDLKNTFMAGNEVCMKSNGTTGNSSFDCRCEFWRQLCGPVLNRQTISNSSLISYCGRKYENCQHTCDMLKHSGLCPPCKNQVLRTCNCGKGNAYLRCGQLSIYQCSGCCREHTNDKRHLRTLRMKNNKQGKEVTENDVETDFQTTGNLSIDNLQQHDMPISKKTSISKKKLPQQSGTDVYDGNNTNKIGGDENESVNDPNIIAFKHLKL